MSLSNEEQFNEEWRSLFKDAAESPSDELWDSIARRLDEEETEPIIPLWPRAKPWVYSVAAAVMTLLIGWWATQSIENADTNRPVASQTVGASQATADRLANQKKPSSSLATTPTNPATTQSQNSQSSETAGNSDGILAANSPANSKKHTPGKTVKPELESTETNSTIDGISQDQSVLSGSRKANISESSQPKTLLATKSRRTNSSFKPGPVSGNTEPELTLEEILNSDLVTQKAASNNTTIPGKIENPAADTRLAYEASYIKNKEPVSKNPAPISRIIWYRAPEMAIEPQEKGGSKKEYWAALTATPMSFNPMTTVQSSLKQAFVSGNAVQQSSRQAVSPLQNQAQFSMAWQASSGVQFSKHWSVEAGVQYLNGRSQAQNNASVTNAFTNQSENLLVNAIRNSTPSPSQLAAAPSTNQSFLPAYADKSNLANSAYLTVVPANQVVSNDFQYVQIPVQVGYHILPDRKISYSVLGGLMANVFLKNTIDGSLEINAADQVYRQMSMAGTAGLRVNYHPTHHWSGSLTGSYQQSLQNGTESGAQLQVHPQAVGVGFGLNYHF